jgi:CheY-like chemotaxis protein
MGIAVYCVGSDAARVARALSGGRRRVSCTRLPASVELVVRCVKQKTPDLIVLGGDASRAAAVAEALADEPSAEGAAVVAWGLEGTHGMARLVALGAQGVPSGDESLRRACEELLDAREGRTVRVDPVADQEAEMLHGKRVLIAEDHPAVAWYFGDTLRRAGCVVEEVHDGWAALDRARRWGPDVVLTDIRMPGLDGLRLCRALRGDPVLADVPVVMLSWKEDWLVRAREADVGATAYLGKHAVPQDVVACVRQAIARHIAFEARFREAGPVRGLLGDISAHRLLRVAAASKTSARLTVQSGTFGYEVHLREGAPVTAARVSAAGDELRGPAALGALLSVRAGRFVVTADRTKVDPDLHGTLHQLAAPHVARAREDGPHPVPTPSIPIVVAPTETIKLESPVDASLPISLVRRPAQAAVPAKPAAKTKQHGFVHEAWRTMLRAVALAAVASLTVALGADTHPVTSSPTAAIAAPEPSLDSPAQAMPGIRAARTAPLHPR